MRTRLELGSSGIVDLFDDVSYPLNYSIADIRNVNKRNSNFSKTIRIPGSKNNNIRFAHIFEIDIDCNFNPNIKTPCRLYIDELLVMSGFLQLLKVVRTFENKLEYEVAIRGNVGNIFTDWADLELTDLNLSAYNHTYNKTNQKASWTATLGQGYVYPMIDYGFTNGLTYDVENFYPAIYLKQYIDSAFALVGYTYESAFFDTDFFKRLIVPFNSTTLMLTTAQLNARYFKAGRSADYTAVTMVSEPLNSSYRIRSNANYAVATKLQLNTDVSDVSNQYNTSTYTYTVANTGSYVLKSTISFQFDVSTLTNPTVTTEIKASGIIAKIDSLGLFSNTLASFNYLGGQEVIANNASSTVRTFTFESPVTTLIAGETYNLGIIIPDCVLNDPTATVGLKILNTTILENRPINTGISDGNTLELNGAIPAKIKIKDLFMSVVKMFNLYIESDKTISNKYYIEPRDDFYANGTTIDWTDKLDTSQDLEIVPMGELNASTYEFKYKEDKDWLNTKYQNAYQQPFGTHIKEIDTDFVKATQTVDIIFSPTPLTKIGTTDRIISQILAVADNGNLTQVKNANIRILYFTLKDTDNSWEYTGDISGTSTETQYPYAGHIDVPLAPTFDLNFGVPKEIYYDTNYFTNATLFNVYYKKFIEEISDKDSKIVRGMFYLTPKDIHLLDFRNQIKVKNHLLRLNKIYDYDINSNELTKCEFIRIKYAQPFGNNNSLSIYGNNISYNTGELAPINSFGNTAVFNNTNVIGDNNVVDSTANNIIVNGSNNYVGGGSSNVSIFGSSGVTVLQDLTNVTVFNSTNVLVTQSNTTVINNVFYYLDGNSEQGITATAGGGQTNAYQTVKQFNLIETCATLGDSVKTIYATLDNKQVFKNVGAQTLYVYPQSGERFRRGTTLMAIDAPYPVASRNSLSIYCYENGIWTD